MQEKIINSPVSLYNIFNHNNSVINTKIGKLYIYCSNGQNAKKFEEGKEAYQMETIVNNEEVNSFCYWLNQNLIVEDV